MRFARAAAESGISHGAQRAVRDPLAVHDVDYLPRLQPFYLE
jgi:hypothetical protein